MDKEQKAMERIRFASELSLQYFEKPLIITTSGGKDSDVCLELARRSGIPYEVQHNLTTADAPQTIRHIRSQFQRIEQQGIPCKINSPVYKGVRTSMWALIVIKRIPPTPLQRYCCEVLKEQGGRHWAICTGVRWAESTKRLTSRTEFESFTKSGKGKSLLDMQETRDVLSNHIIVSSDNDPRRRFLEHCRMQGKVICNPIINWKDADVWTYIQTNPLYACGFHRSGCIGCPMAGKQRYFEFRMFPKYEGMYRRAIARMLELRRREKRDEHSTSWKTLDSFWRWWMEDANVEGQIRLDGI